MLGAGRHETRRQACGHPGPYGSSGKPFQFFGNNRSRRRRDRTPRADGISLVVGWCAGRGSAMPSRGCCGTQGRPDGDGGLVPDRTRATARGSRACCPDVRDADTEPLSTEHRPAAWPMPSTGFRAEPCTGRSAGRSRSGRPWYNPVSEGPVHDQDVGTDEATNATAALKPVENRHSWRTR